MDDILSFATDQLFIHWPFIMVVAILSVVGQVMSQSVFTRARAYKKQKSQSFWWWMRETLPLHPILSGVLIGLLWQNPESADPAWGFAANMGYFAGAGATSLFAWSVARGYLKQRGIDLEFPGGTTSLTPPPSEDKADIVEESENS